MIDHGEMLIRLKTFLDCTTKTAFNDFYSSWIAYFDYPIYVIKDRGENFSAKLMKEKLHSEESQICPVPTEAPWDIGVNERSNRYLHKSIDRLLL